jgi:predicted transcriptional regulator
MMMRSGDNERKLGDNRQKILDMMNRTPRISFPQLASEIGISDTAV